MNNQELLKELELQEQQLQFTSFSNADALAIGMALYEDVTYTGKGMIMENSFMQYKIPSRVDLPTFRTEIAKGSYEPSGPFGVKSVGEVVINTASPAIAHAVANATGVRIRELPITPEKILRGLHKIGE